MTILFVILIILASVILGAIVLIQNPKGGGLAGNIAGFSNQFMGVKQTTDVLEKGTWLFAGIIAALCIVSSIFISGGSATDTIEKVSTPQPVNVPQQQPANAAPFQQGGTQQQNPNPATPDSN
ncbi:MAG TPA: preprotein translocase subunit SecG [Chitinophagaceae bacterium]|jgi:preprotein translocase subunit SecG|nr:preprotein translocase subunit SecG [Chitinophagaceae bacterium]